MKDPKAKRRVAARKRCTKNLDGYEHVPQKDEFALLQTLALFHLVEFVKLPIFLELNS